MKRILLILAFFTCFVASAQYKPVQIPQLSYPANDDILQRKNNKWVPRSIAQLRIDLNIADSLWVLAALEEKVDKNDTATMLSPYQTAINAKQPLDADLTTIAGLTATTDNFIVSDSSAWASRTPAQVKSTLSLNNVDNTSDANKPVSTATQTALDGKVDENAAITGATKTKITYDAKGLVTSGADATTTDISEGTNQYFTEARARASISLTRTGVEPTYSSSTGVINIPDDPAFQVAALLGSTIKGATINGHTFINSASSLSIADGTIYWCAAWLPEGATLAGFKFWQQTSGVYTADNNNKIGLYTYDGAGTLTLVGATLNDANLWAGAGASTITAPLSSTYVASAGLYFIAVLYNSSAVTTAPTIGTTTAAGLSGATGFDFTNSAKTFGITNGTDLPATQPMSGITGSTSRPYIALY